MSQLFRQHVPRSLSQPKAAVLHAIFGFVIVILVYAMTPGQSTHEDSCL